MDRQTCQSFGRSLVRHEKRSPQGETRTGFSDSCVTSPRACQAGAGSTGREIGPWRAASGVGPVTESRITTCVGHSRTQMPQPMHSPTWTGNSIIQLKGLPKMPAPSTPGRCGRLMSSAWTGQTSMQTPQFRQLLFSIWIR